MKTNLCKKGDSFEDCELAILRHQVDEGQEKLERRKVSSPEVQEMITIVEDFIKRKGLVCYGGIAINALLPDDEKIYDDEVDLPDYDFFSPNALEDAKELADIYFKKGYFETEAKGGQHHGTYKVFVNFQGMADITSIPKDLYQVIKSRAIQVKGIYYTDPNYLKMSMYLELSRPAGDTSRWEKVLKRLTAINKNYPLEAKNCDYAKFQRRMADDEQGDEIFEIVKDTFINQGVVFFGGFAVSQYSQYMPADLRKKVEKIADFDVLAKNPEETAEIVKERLIQNGIKNAKIIRKEPVGEVIPEHYQVLVGRDTVAFIYKPVGCHSYNVLMTNKQKIKIATIDTMLSFYLAFLYSKRDYYEQFTDRILCMSKFLFDVQQKNRLEQKGLLKRFSITCYGHQESMEDMKAEKAEMFKKLKDKRGTTEYEEWFLNYRPANTQSVNHIVKKHRSKSKKQNKNYFNFLNFNKKKSKKRRKKFF
jgi:hypothetical protein